MATTGVNGIFVDTNILVYTRVAHSPLYLQATERLAELDATGAQL